MQGRLEENVPQVLQFTVEMPHWFSCRSMALYREGQDKTYVPLKPSK